MAISAALGLLLGACGSGEGGGPGADGGAAGEDGGGGAADGGDDAGFETLAAGEWELPSADEGYFCVRKTVEEDIYVGGFEAIAPLGTHHTVVTVGDPSGPDGVEECTTFVNHNRMIFGSGVGTNPIEFPEGVAMRIEAGQQVLVNLHVFNATGEPLSGTSGTKIKRMDPGDVAEEAEAILMGPTNLRVKEGESTESGTCTVRSDVTLFAVGPHMHQLGTHMEVVARSSVAGDTVIHDAPYDFDSQILHLVEPQVAMKQGDPVEVFCTYNNDTGAEVGWGESTNDEMCFAGVYLYPAGSPYFLCDDDALPL